MLLCSGGPGRTACHATRKLAVTRSRTNRTANRSRPHGWSRPRPSAMVGSGSSVVAASARITPTTAFATLHSPHSSTHTRVSQPTGSSRT